METVIKFENYKKILKGRMVLNDINIEMKSGNIYKLRGTNGSGKTMLLRAISGLIYPTDGKMLVNDVEITNKSIYPVSLGVLIENPSFWKDYTGYELLKYLADIRGVIGKEEIEYNMERMGLEPTDKRKISKYSLGMRQKLGIIQAVMEKPDVLLLDEPLNALDGQSIKKFEHLLNEERERGALIVLAIHNDGDFMMDYDEVYLLEEGRIV